MRHSRLAAILVMIAIALPAQAQTPTVSEIQSHLAAHGGRATILRYFDQADAPGLALVETGQADAVGLAIQMLAYSDAGDTTALLSSLGTAMGMHPEAVLPYLHRDRTGRNLLTPSRLCLPFMDADRPRAAALALVARQRRALETLRLAALQSQKQECLAEIARAERIVRQRP